MMRKHTLVIRCPSQRHMTNFLPFMCSNSFNHEVGLICLLHGTSTVAHFISVSFSKLLVKFFLELPTFFHSFFFFCHYSILIACILFFFFNMLSDSFFACFLACFLTAF